MVLKFNSSLKVPYFSMLSVINSIVFVCLFSFKIFSQINANTYPLTISSGEVLYNMSNSDTALFNGSVSPPSDTLSFGKNFIFNFCGNDYTTFSAAAQGYITLGRAADYDPGYNFLNSTNFPLIAPYYCGEMRIQGTGLLPGSALYKLVGTAPNRKFVIEWELISDDIALSGNNKSFKIQLWLSEETNKIEFVYGGVPAHNDFYSIGLAAKKNLGYFAGIKIASSINSSSISYASANVNTNNPLAIPSGTKFTFDPIIAPPTSINFNPVEAGCITVNWKDGSNNEDIFRVFRSTDNIKFIQVAVIPSSTVSSTGTNYSFSDKCLKSNKKYYYKVQASNYSSGRSPSISSSVTTMIPTGLSGLIKVPGDFNTISEAISALSCRKLSGDVIIEMQNSYTDMNENFPISFCCINDQPTIHSVTIRPAANATNVTISGKQQAVPVFEFDNTTTFTIDGRSGGIGSQINLTIGNNSNQTSVIRIINGSQKNSISYCNIIGATANDSSGVIFFGEGIDTTGNSYNTISNCNIHSSLSLPTCLLYSKAKKIPVNKSNKLYNCNFYDFMPIGLKGASIINVGIGNDAWDIVGNHFFQTTPLTFYNDTLSILNVSSPKGNNFLIRDNFFGGNTETGAGLLSVSSGFLNLFMTICLTVDTIQTSLIRNNHFENMEFPGPLGASFICGLSGNFLIDSNVIGNNTINHTINGIIGSDSTYAGMANPITGIDIWKSNSIVIANNKIGGITAGFGQGISVSDSRSVNIYNNLIGSQTNKDNILCVGSFQGINLSSCYGICKISNNRMQNITGTSDLNYGIGQSLISISGADNLIGKYSVKDNIIKYIISGGAVRSIHGIYIGKNWNNKVNSKNEYTIDNNEIGAILNKFNTTNYTVGNNVSGINVNLDSNMVLIKNNYIYNVGQYLQGSITGIIASGKLDINNNIIFLGSSPDGSPLPLGTLNYGLIRFSGITAESVLNLCRVRNNTISIGYLPKAIQGDAFGISAYNDSIINNIISIHYFDKLAPLKFTPIFGTFQYSDYNLYYCGNILEGPDASAWMYKWRNDFGGDKHSVYGNPKFIKNIGIDSVFDFHLKHNSPARNKGKVIPSIPFDFDGQLRKLANYDIGAYEYLFQNPKNDISPSLMNTKDIYCYMDTDINVAVINRGRDTIHNCDISWSVDGNIIDTIQWNGTLLPGDTTNSILLGVYKWAKNKIYSVKVLTIQANSIIDDFQDNDTTLVLFDFNTRKEIHLGNDTSACDPQFSTPIQLNAGSGFYNYTWSTGEKTQYISAPITDSYIASATSDYECLLHDTINVTIFPLPNVSITKVGDSLKSSSLYNNLWGNTINVYFADTSNTILATQAGMYWVVVKNEFGCKNRAEITITDVVSLKNETGLKIKLTPNPASSNIVLNIETQQQISGSNVNLQVLNIMGESVLKKGFTIHNNIASISLDINSISNGMYFVNILSDDLKVLVSDKFTKQ